MIITHYLNKTIYHKVFFGVLYKFYGFVVDFLHTLNLSKFKNEKSVVYFDTLFNAIHVHNFTILQAVRFIHFKMVY